MLPRRRICSLLLSCTAFGNGLYAQNTTDTVWYGADKQTLKDRAGAVFYSLPLIKTDSGYRFAEYYLNGILRSQGYATTAANLIRTGYYTLYDSSGYKITEGFYRKGMRHGLWRDYFLHSNRRWAEGEYQNDALNGTYRAYDSLSGLMRLEGSFTNGLRTGLWQHYYGGTDKLYRIGAYEADKRQGEFKCYYRNGALKRLDIYEAGEIKKGGKRFDSLGKPIAYTPFVTYPEYKGNLEKLLKRELHDKGTAAGDLTYGISYFRFELSRDGRASGLELVPGHDANTEYIKSFFAQMGDWKPMVVDNHTVAAEAHGGIKVEKEDAWIHIEFKPAEDFTLE